MAGMMSTAPSSSLTSQPARKLMMLKTTATSTALFVFLIRTPGIRYARSRTVAVSTAR
jgi:hypothetical protein